MGLSGKVVVITGSTRGIGRAIADACALKGATVVVSSRTPEAVERTVAELTAAEEPGRTTGRIYPILGTGRVIVGGAKMAWWGMTGKMARG